MSQGARYFEELWVWQQARILVKNAYADFGETTPASKDFGFRNQIQRAAISVMNNIAEGFERGTNIEFARFLEIAKGSYGEVRGMYYIAEDLHYVSGTIAADRRESCRKISAGIASLASRLRSAST